jgi:hypothetical protein
MIGMTSPRPDDSTTANLIHTRHHGDGFMRPVLNVLKHRLFLIVQLGGRSRPVQLALASLELPHDIFH